MCTLSLYNKVLHNIILNKNNKYKKQIEKDLQTIKPFDKLNRNSFQGNVIDKSEYECLCNIWKKQKTNRFNKFEHKKLIALVILI